MELNIELIEQLRIINEHIQNYDNTEKIDEDLDDSYNFCKII